MNRIGQFFLNLLCYDSDESVAMTTRLSWLPFKFRSILLGMASREETLSSREAFIRFCGVFVDAYILIKLAVL